jgi:hypothetical protein
MTVLPDASIGALAERGSISTNESALQQRIQPE